MLKKKYRIVRGYYFIRKYIGEADICEMCKFYKETTLLCSQINTNSSDRLLYLCQKSTKYENVRCRYSDISYYPDQKKYTMNNKNKKIEET